MRAIVLLSAAFAYLLWKLSASPEILEGQTQVGYSLDGSSAVEIDGILLLVGEAAVFFFYWFKFNEWAGEGDGPKGFSARPVRHFTTWLRFLGWGSTYALIMVAVFNVLVFFPDIVSHIIDSFARASAEMQTPLVGLTEAQSLSGLLGQDAGTTSFLGQTNPSKLIPYAVILVTVVWADLHPFRQIERRFRHQLQERAAIPAQASELIATLASHRIRFEPDRKIRAKLVKQSGGIVSEADFADASDTNDPWCLYARIEYLFDRLQQYRFKPLFTGLSARYSGEYHELEDQLLGLRARIQTQLHEIRDELEDNLRNTIDASDPRLKEEISGLSQLDLHAAERELSELNEKEHSRLRIRHFENQHKEIQEQVTVVWVKLRELMVCSILAVGRTPRHRVEMFDDFGIKLRSAIAIQFDWHTGIVMVGAVVGIVFAGSWAYQGLLNQETQTPISVPEDTAEIVWWSVVAAAMHLLGALGGYITQRSLELRRERMSLGDPRPAVNSELAAETIMAAIFSVALNVVLLALLLASSGQFHLLVDQWWWALLPGVTGAFTAKYAQTESQRRLRALDTGNKEGKLRVRPLWIQAAITGGTALGIVVLQYSDPTLNGVDGFSWKDTNLWVYIGYVGLTNVAIGLGIGWVLRRWVHDQTTELIKEDRRRKHDEEGYWPERRSNRRMCPARAKWLANEKDYEVEVLSISDNGAALLATEPLPTDGEGCFAMSEDDSRKAEIARRDSADANRYYIRYLDEAA